MTVHRASSVVEGLHAAQGISQAVPKAILALMNVEGMTRENVASHLQKYRIWLKRLAGYPSGARVSPEMLQQVQPKRCPAASALDAVIAQHLSEAVLQLSQKMQCLCS